MKTMVPRFLKNLGIYCAVMALLSGCAGGIEKRSETASNIAQNAGFTHQNITASPFTLSSWKKLTAPGAPIHVYIEGDGLAWLSRSTPSRNPTPKNPIGLRLTAADQAANIAYLARPCQYVALGKAGGRCEQSYWTQKRFAKEVIESYQNALNALVKQGAQNGFHLIGYSGGANIAGLLAASRNDVLSLRSVVGNLDNDFFTQYHKVSPMPLSLNMADFAQKLKTIPQYHFIAEEDENVPPAIFRSYASKLGPSHCVQSSRIKGTSHASGWPEQWPALLKRTPECKTAP